MLLKMSYHKNFWIKKSSVHLKLFLGIIQTITLNIYANDAWLMMDILRSLPVPNCLWLFLVPQTDVTLILAAY